MKRLLLLAATALAFPAAANAVPTLNLAALDDGVAIVLTCPITGNPSTSGNIACTGTSAHYDITIIAAQGNPVLPQPDLSSLNITATATIGGTNTLTVDAFQTGLTSPPQTLSSTFTINHLVGAPFGPSTLTDYINGTSSTLGTLLAPGASFPAGDTNDTVHQTNVVSVPITADAEQYVVTTTALGQSMTDTIQLVTAAPEPASLALLGTGLVGLGYIVRRRRRS